MDNQILAPIPSPDWELKQEKESSLYECPTLAEKVVYTEKEKICLQKPTGRKSSWKEYGITG